MDDVVSVGHSRNDWALICKTSSESGGWVKTTRALKVGQGVLVQVTTENNKGVAEALSYIPVARLIKCDKEECSYIV